MPKTGRRPRQRRTPAAAVRVADERPLLARILDTPHLAQLVPRLPPELLHRVIETCGLEECGELVALATPDQLRRVLDLDLWRANRGGRDERFDADRFAVWLEVLADLDPSVAAEQLSKIDADLAIAGLAQHVRVFDVASLRVSAGTEEDGATPTGAGDTLTQEIGGYQIAARRAGAWDAIVSMLIALDADRPDHFHRLMRGCRTLSNSVPEIDGLHDLLTDGEQAMFDLAFDRERRRERQGFVTPAQARAFLQMARQFKPHSRETSSPNPVARAYFRALEPQAPAGADVSAPRLTASSESALAADVSDASVAAVVELLRDAGVVAQPPRALLDAPRREGRARLARMEAQLQVLERDEAASSNRTQELAYLANVLAAGCSIQDRPLTPQEASDAAAAVCNLGLENWPAPLPDDLLVGQDLVTVFQAGWAILHERVCMHTAQRLVAILSPMRCADREIQFGLDVLRIEMTKHWRAGAPWRARRHIDVIATLDMPAWAALLALVDELPVLHAAVTASQDGRTRSVSPSAFEFISENSQVAAADGFLDVLPDILRR